MDTSTGVVAAPPKGKKTRSASAADADRSRSRSEENTAAGARPTRSQTGVSDLIQLLQAQVGKLTSRLTTLEAEHAAGQVAISSFADRLVFENEKLDARLMDLQTANGAHLSVIDETFQRCDRAMEELRTASQAAMSAAAELLESGATRSPPAF